MKNSSAQEPPKSGAPKRKGPRPDPVRWLYYSYGGTLPMKYREWVLYDLTGPTRWARQVARTVGVLAPFALAGVLLTSGSWIGWTAALGGLGLALIFALSYIDQSAENRLRKYGYPADTFARIMSEKHADETATRMARYDVMYRHN